VNVDRYLLMIARAFLPSSPAVGYWMSPYWYLFTVPRKPGVPGN
jgi:hypothetical protein